MKWRKFLRWPSAPDGQKAAESALRRAEAARKEAEDRQPAVSEAAGALRRARQENHFAARFRASIEGRSA
ncbi:DUF7620 family protein [Streptomyces rubiginosohelvolus]|uniref:Uncharacterized protein n=1 Tax=Streptomyces rubiginosohelvolus TaxID=67362 RepID=A0ABQ3CD41_9ACTN|nr:hypothetical protein [Streptomyces pluricolorescens]GGZ82160.1 hypothetical protein GCM10010328_65830 [Streptomyces pluricolorescens]